jgi:Skp family chaperone for outer membrane proteins
LLLNLPSGSKPDAYASTLPIFHAFVRISDHLVNNARFRPEALRRVKETREAEKRKIRRLDEDEKAEDRKLKADKEKKEKRDAALRGLSAEEQRKYLEKERERDQRRKEKRKTVKA